MMVVNIKRLKNGVGISEKNLIITSMIFYFFYIFSYINYKKKTFIYILHT